MGVITAGFILIFAGLALRFPVSEMKYGPNEQHRFLGQYQNTRHEDATYSHEPIDTSHPLVPFKASHYWPDAPPTPGTPYPGWPNCGRPLVNGHCQSVMGGSGLEWDEYVQVAIACPLSYPTWTVIVIVEPESIAGIYVCLDHGGAIVETSSGDWLDFLWPLETWPLKHGEVVYGYIQ
jgi:hypothetical protein